MKSDVQAPDSLQTQSTEPCLDGQPTGSKRQLGGRAKVAIGAAVALALLAIAVCLSGKTCLVHNWVAADCSEPRHCLKCGKEDGSELDPTRHTWQEATCVAPRTCWDCGITDGDANPDNHDWRDATCLMPMHCKNCGETKGTTTGHQYEDGVCEICGVTDPNAAGVSSDSNGSSTPTASDGSSPSSQAKVDSSSAGQSKSSGEGDSYSSYEITQDEAKDKAVRALYEELVEEAEVYTDLNPGSCKYSVGTVEFDSVTDGYIVYGQVSFVSKNGGAMKVGSRYMSDWHCNVSKYGLTTTCYLF